MKNFIYYRNIDGYPVDEYYRPGQYYPEYKYGNLGLSKTPNDVYDMIRELFIELELDKEHIGTKEWSPLSEYIALNDTVLVKPNLVKHINEAIRGKRGLECLITNPSVIRCIIDYVLIALNNTGRIIVGDAPVQSCDFQKLKKDAGIIRLEEFYKNAGEFINFVDLRNYRSKRINGNVIEVKLPTHYKGKVINLGKESYFYNDSSEGKLRITNYDYRIVNSHHTGERNEYCISEACLAADVIINLPKPKTHRKAGYTGALKNMVGVNCMKDYLPHHTKGAFVTNKGDEYYFNTKFSQIKSDICDVTDILDKKKLYKMSSWIKNLAGLYLKGKKDKEKYSEGSWWGNNTIWKTILDLNTIVLYADKNGKMKKTEQRKVITIGDMIVAGEKEGPLLPLPIKTNTILFADNSVLFDKILVRFMGFQTDKFILLREAEKNIRLYKIDENECRVLSNYGVLNSDLQMFKGLYKFNPSFGWKEYIG